MTRQDLHNKLNNIIPTYSVGFNVGSVESDCLILRKATGLPSVSSGAAGWDQWIIEAYSKRSPLQIDKMLQDVTEMLLNNTSAEIVTPGGTEYWDNRYNCFASSMQIKTPKALR